MVDGARRIADLAPVTGGDAMSETIRIRMGGYGPPTTTHSRGLKFLGDRLIEQFGDRVDIVYAWNVMDLGYGSDAVLWLTECGMLDLAYMSTTALTDRVPALEFADLPFLFADNATARAAYDGALGRHLIAAIEARCNFRVLGFFENGFRHLSNRHREVRRPEDLAGMSIRTLGSDTHNRTFELLGMQPQSMRLDEAKIAIGEGRVDAQENPFANTMTYGIHQAHGFHTLSNHFYLSRGVYANPQSFDAWPAEVREAVLAAIPGAVAHQRELAVAEEDIARGAIEKAGGEVYELTADDHAAFAAAVAPIYDEARARFGDAMFALIGR
jgi:TRAP-type C4-dicarboxylate transport system substrate-binding protein